MERLSPCVSGCEAPCEAGEEEEEEESCSWLAWLFSRF